MVCCYENLFKTSTRALLKGTRILNTLLRCTTCVLLRPQVTVVGVVRGVTPFVTHILYSVDDMTGPPLKVRLWMNSEVGGVDSLSTYFAPTLWLHYFHLPATVSISLPGLCVFITTSWYLCQGLGECPSSPGTSPLT